MHLSATGKRMSRELSGRKIPCYIRSARSGFGQGDLLFGAGQPTIGSRQFFMAFENRVKTLRTQPCHERRGRKVPLRHEKTTVILTPPFGTYYHLQLYGADRLLTHTIIDSISTEQQRTKDDTGIFAKTHAPPPAPSFHSSSAIGTPFSSPWIMSSPPAQNVLVPKRITPADTPTL